jgi:uncharacterized surface protein with fasciclin (FAS1) repeats
MMAKAKAKAIGGKYETVSGDTLSAEAKSGARYIVDEAAAKVTVADVTQSNGVSQVVNKVALPK